MGRAGVWGVAWIIFASVLVPASGLWSAPGARAESAEDFCPPSFRGDPLEAARSTGPTLVGKGWEGWAECAYGEGTDLVLFTPRWVEPTYKPIGADGPIAIADIGCYARSEDAEGTVASRTHFAEVFHSGLHSDGDYGATTTLAEQILVSIVARALGCSTFTYAPCPDTLFGMVRWRWSGPIPQGDTRSYLAVICSYGDDTPETREEHAPVKFALAWAPDGSGDEHWACRGESFGRPLTTDRFAWTQGKAAGVEIRAEDEAPLDAVDDAIRRSAAEALLGEIVPKAVACGSAAPAGPAQDQCPAEVRSTKGKLGLTDDVGLSWTAGSITGITAAEFAYDCVYGLALNAVHLTLAWSEHAMHETLGTCSSPGFVGDPDPQDAYAQLRVTSASKQAAVVFGGAIADLDQAAAEALARRILEGLDAVAIPCSTPPAPFGEWPACPATLDLAIVDSAGVSRTVTIARSGEPVQTRRPVYDGWKSVEECDYTAPHNDRTWQGTLVMYWHPLFVSQHGRNIFQPDACALFWSSGDITGKYGGVSVSDLERLGVKEFDVASLEPMRSQVAALARPCDTPEPVSTFLSKGWPRGGDAPAGPKQVMVSGILVAFDKNNDWIDLAEVRVRVLFEHAGGTTVVETATDRGGFYSATVEADPATVRYAVGVELAHVGGVFEVRVGPELTPPIPVYTTALRAAKGNLLIDTVFHNVYFKQDTPASASQRITPQGFAPDPSPLSSVDAREFAVIYANTWRAMDYARTTLKLAYDHQLPVWVVPRDRGEETHYWDGRMVIVPADSPFDSKDAPDNREMHEWGHHVEVDAPFGGENRGIGLQPGDVAHNGVTNVDSRDALREGFAEFYSCLVRGSPLYTMGGPPQNFQENFHTDPTTGVPGRPWEEGNVAALLWDLMDDDRETGDRLSLGVDGVWTALQQSRAQTVHGLYEDLRAQGIGAAKGDPADPLTDLDAIFVLHRFFVDRDADGAWGPDEEIGYAGYWHKAKDPTAGFDLADPALRNRVPDRNGQLLEIAAVGGQAPTAVSVALDFADPALDRTYLSPVVDGRAAILVPATAISATVVPIAAGLAGAAISFTPEQFEQGVATAATTGSQTFGSVTVDLQPSAVEAPSDLRAATRPDGTFALSWSVPEGIDRVVVVRGADHVPRHPADGIVLFDGSGTSATDPRPVPGAPSHYAAFSIAATGAFSAPATTDATAYGATETAARAQAGSGGDEDQDGAPLPGAALLLVALAAATAAARRRR